MKKLLAALLVFACLSTALAGEIPGSNPGAPPCTENCPQSNAEPVIVSETEYSVGEFLADMLAFVL